MSEYSDVIESRDAGREINHQRKKVSRLGVGRRDAEGGWGRPSRGVFGADICVPVSHVRSGHVLQTRSYEGEAWWVGVSLMVKKMVDLRPKEPR